MGALARIRSKGLDGLPDVPRTGRPATVDAAPVVLGALQRPDPPGAGWCNRSLGAGLGISNVAVGNVWRDWGIRPEPGGRVSLRTEPVLDADVQAVLGLHIDPPVYLFALVVTDPGRARTEIGADPPAPRHGLGNLLVDLLTSAESTTGGDGQAAVAAFLARLDHARGHTIRSAPSAALTPAGPAASATRASPMTPVRTALIAVGDADLVRELSHGRTAVARHAVTAVAGWQRVVRVLASAEPDGAVSVDDLGTARDDHHRDRHGGPFTWTRPPS